MTREHVCDRTGGRHACRDPFGERRHFGMAVSPRYIVPFPVVVVVAVVVVIIISIVPLVVCVFCGVCVAVVFRRGEASKRRLQLLAAVVGKRVWAIVVVSVCLSFCFCLCVSLCLSICGCLCVYL